MRAGRRPLVFLLLLACLAPSGCRHGNAELLESELRARDLQYREVLDELRKSEFQKESLQREIESLRTSKKFSPELAAHTFGLHKLTLGRGTSGVDNDHMPGDDALQVILEPRDADEHVIKAPGTLEITVLEVSFQGTKSVLSTWEIGQEQLRHSWKQSLFSTGYVVVLPWKSWPRSENLRVVARLVLTDGRMFEADKDVKIRLPQGMVPQPLPAPKELVPPGKKGPEAKARTGVHQARWQPAPLLNVVNLGRPEPIEPPPPVNLLGLTRDLPDPFAVWGPGN